ncbi:gas vesicle protein GvpG [Paenibacillus barcinonensis]|uniref:gas vesicle protein GvpG n=1 Tax=Paenibacillus barcinonensis TaxID=198119 RepID=UPI001C11D86C|nr:gas vesicle protein GvpG [Paenibacillus barcinonensis]MBU5352671.1 gas vesicle protein GvpG [Paenibacillus barcinonensis]
MKRSTTSKTVKVTSALALTIALGGSLLATASVHADPAAKASDALQNKRYAPIGSHILKPPGEAEKGLGLGPWFGPHTEEVLSVLGLSKDELKNARKADQSLAEIAASKNIEVQTLIDQLVAPEKKELQQQLTDSKITQAQYDERLAALTERVTTLVKEKPSEIRAHKPEPGLLPAPGLSGGFGLGPELDRNVDKLASLLGVTASELTSSLQNGKSLAEIATAQNVNVQTLIQQLVNARKADLQQELKDGKITQAQYDERVADLTQRITDLVNGTRPSVGPKHHHGSRLKDEADSSVNSVPKSDTTNKSTSEADKNPA